jgi:hypothetical protein
MCRGSPKSAVAVGFSYETKRARMRGMRQVAGQGLSPGLSNKHSPDKWELSQYLAGKHPVSRRNQNQSIGWTHRCSIFMQYIVFLSSYGKENFRGLENEFLFTLGLFNIF